MTGMNMLVIRNTGSQVKKRSEKVGILWIAGKQNCNESKGSME
jgi:hypothetical protein